MEQKTAFLFPGQGVSSEDLINFYKRLEVVDPHLTRQRDDLLQESLSSTISGRPRSFNFKRAMSGEGLEDFSRTDFVQPVIYTLSTLAYEIASQSKGLKPDFVAGHSLGEYAALIAAGSLGVNQGIDLVSFRGELMQDDCDQKDSRLVSINGLDEGQVQKVCDQTGAEMALINAPNLIAVGSEMSLISDIQRVALEKKAKQTTVLPTAGAFHTSLMKGSSQGMYIILSLGCSFEPLQTSLIANLTGNELKGESIKNTLVQSMTKPVQWAKIIQNLKNQGVNQFIEVGPGSSLSILNRLNGIPKGQTRNILDLI